MSDAATLPKLVICGSIAIDRIMHFPGTFMEAIDPGKLDVLSVSFLLDSSNTSKGGVAANMAFVSGQLGEKPLLYGSIGSDGADYLLELQAAGVDTSQTHVSELPTATFNVFTDSANNQIGGFYPGAMADAASLTFAAWQPDEIFVVVSAHDPTVMRAQTDECAARGLRLFYDPGQQVSNVPGEDLRAGIEAAEVLAVNEYEHDILCQKTGLSAEELAGMVPVLIITKGAEGSIIMGQKVAQPILIPVVDVPHVLDPSGAGDSYRAGFLYGYLRQWSLGQCGYLAATLASFVVERQGSLCKLSRPEIAMRYEEKFKREIDFDGNF